MRPFLFNAVVWGADYVDKLVRWIIPALLAPDNVPSLVERRECRMLVVTDNAEHIARLQAAASVKALSAYLSFEYITNELTGDVKYHRMTAGHKIICARGRELNAYGVFLLPDILISNTTLSCLDRAVERGARTVIMTSPRVTEEDLVFLPSDVIDLSSRELVKLIFEHPQAECRTMMLQNQDFNAEPGYVIDIIEQGRLWTVNGVHAWPMLLDLAEADTGQIGYSIDTENFVISCIKDAATAYVVMDSDEAVFCSLTPRELPPYCKDRTPPNADSVRKFLGNHYVNDLHRWYFRHSVVFHTEALPEDIKERLAAHENFVRSVVQG